MLVSPLLGKSKFLDSSKNLTIFGVIVAVAFVIWSLVAENVADLYNIPYYLDWLVYMDPQGQSSIFAIALFVLVIWFIFRKPTPANPNPKPKSEGDED